MGCIHYFVDQLDEGCPYNLAKFPMEGRLFRNHDGNDSLCHMVGP